MSRTNICYSWVLSTGAYPYEWGCVSPGGSAEKTSCHTWCKRTASPLHTQSTNFSITKIISTAKNDRFNFTNPKGLVKSGCAQQRCRSLDIPMADENRSMVGKQMLLGITITKPLKGWTNIQNQIINYFANILTGLEKRTISVNLNCQRYCIHVYKNCKFMEGGTVIFHADHKDKTILGSC